MNSSKSIFTIPESVASKTAPTITLRPYQTKRHHSDPSSETTTTPQPIPPSPQQCQTTVAQSTLQPHPTAKIAAPAGHGHLPPPSATVPGESFKTPLVPRPSHIDISPQSNPTKRSFALSESPITPDSHTSVEFQRKRLRIERPTRHTLDPFSFTVQLSDTLLPNSPLFFSHSPQVRPLLPPRFSSSEAGAKMLSNAKDEDAGIRTVTLARGKFTTGSPPARPHNKSRGSVERISTPRIDSPELGDRLEPLRMLSHIGIMELLELDDRPTFIVNLGDASNYAAGPLQVLFANSSLRAFPGLLDSISARAEEEAGQTSPQTFPQFKAWIISASVNGESLDVCLPSFIQGSFSWSCSTLRKRLRIASGTLMPARSTASLTRHNSVLTPSANAESARANGEFIRPASSASSFPSSSITVNYKEPNDYFGNAGMQIEAEGSNRHPKGDILPSVELLQNKTQALPSVDTTTEVDTASRLISADPSTNPLTAEWTSSPSSPSSADGVDHFDGSGNQDVGFFDWTRLPDSEALPDHIQFARSVDWASTALGPMLNWPPDLRQMCNLIMASPHPAAMYWGEDLVAIYNEAYVLLAGQKHPKLMGQSYREAWAEIWGDVKDVFANAQLTGQATMKDDDCLFIKRNDFLEETYFSWSIIPMVGGDGSVMGLYNPAFEKTRRKIAERRMLTLREVGERTAAARDVKGFWDEVLAALECNDFDTPFVILYSLGDESADGEDTSVYSSISSGAKLCFLEGALGVPLGHLAAPETMNLKSGGEGFAPIFREVMKTNKPMVLDTSMDELPQELLDGLEWRGFGDPARAVVVCPIHPTTGESTLGFLVMGINPRRPYDDDYSLFIQLLSRQLATSLASVVLFEEEIRRGQRAAKLAALDRIELSEQLAIRTQEAIESETKFTRMAEFAPVGMFIADRAGRITFCNDTWFEITRVPKEFHSTDRWVDYVLDEDKPLVRELWHDLVAKTKPANAEFRFKARWLDRHGTQDDTWVLFSAYPEKNEDGTLKSVFGSITNISQQKWAAGFQKRKMEEAIELKRQQENFIDITSHEMRNPLSAILQCADEIVNSLSDVRSKVTTGDTSIYDDNIDAAQTIALCAQHQKRIVDDVLTLSKIDSALMVVAPVDVQPPTVVQRALKMFEGELHSADIQMKFVVSPSFKQLGIDWVRFDPSRVLQVLINLTTNAIKFTNGSTRRIIAVSISASFQKPSAEKNPIVRFFPPRSKRVDLTQGRDWGVGNEVYIQFAVEDTGRGLTEEEMKVLFQRFSQASPRTHVQYGGSGLGLFISRELTELQGGEIGVSSESGKGSTFAFFIKARMSVTPEDPTAQNQIHTGRKTAEPVNNHTRKAHTPLIRDFVPTPVAEKSSASSLKVLIVEDNLVNQRVLQKQLIKLGCVTHVANHGVEALEKLQHSIFWREPRGSDALELDLVLMDVEMPVMGGVECVKRIRALQKEGTIASHVPVIAVTANARKEQIDALKEAGMDNVVSKPFRVPELFKEMNALLEKCQPPESLGAGRSW